MECQTLHGPKAPPTAPLSFFSLPVRAGEAAPGTLLPQNGPLRDQPERQDRPLGAHNRIRLDTLFDRNIGARYRPTPNSPDATLAAPDRTRATAVRNSSWDVDVIKRISRDALGNKEATFRGDEKERNVLWTSLVKSL